MTGKRWPVFLELAALETDECVIWPHSGLARYGDVVSPTGRVYVHRQALLLRKAIPLDGGRWEAAHSCRERKCLNYRHLRWATARENQLDRIEDGTSNRGERHGMNAYPESLILTIKRGIAAGERNMDIAERVGIDRHYVAKIKTGQAWAWLDVSA